MTAAQARQSPTRIATPPRKIARRTRGSRHGPITRLMSPGDLGQLLKPFVFLDLFERDTAGSAKANSVVGREATINSHMTQRFLRCAHNVLPPPARIAPDVTHRDESHHRNRRVRKEQIDQGAPWLPALPGESHRPWIAIEQRDDHLCHDATAHGAKLIAGPTNSRFAEDVVPERCFRGPSRGIQTHLIAG
jgi:hypothetical protein